MEKISIEEAYDLLKEASIFGSSDFIPWLAGHSSVDLSDGWNFDSEKLIVGIAELKLRAYVKRASWMSLRVCGSMAIPRSGPRSPWAL